MLSVRHINYQIVFLQTDWRTGWPIYRCKKRHSNGSHMETSPLYESEDCRIQIYARMHLYIGLLNNAGRTTERPFLWGAYHWGAILVGGLPLRGHSRGGLTTEGPFSWGCTTERPFSWGRTTEGSLIIVRGVPLRGHSRLGRTTEGSLSWWKYHWGAILVWGVPLRGHYREGSTTEGPFSWGAYYWGVILVRAYHWGAILVPRRSMLHDPCLGFCGLIRRTDPM